MPELPEVETIRRFLEPALVGRRVVSVQVTRADVVAPFESGALSPRQGRGSSQIRPRALGRALLAGGVVERLERRGKQLAILADDGRAIVVHLGMTGQLLLRRPGERGKALNHVHLTWRFDDGTRLLFRDARRFGGVLAGLSQQQLHDQVWNRLGPDALTITARQLRAALTISSRPLKAALLDQEALAGVGNIYADEAAFRARLNPARPCRDLAGADWTRLAAAIRTVLRDAIAAGGSTLRDYVTPSGSPGEARRTHLVYGRGGLPCSRCGRPLERLTIGQRTTVFCPICQR